MCICSSLDHKPSLYAIKRLNLLPDLYQQTSHSWCKCATDWTPAAALVILYRDWTVCSVSGTLHDGQQHALPCSTMRASFQGGFQKVSSITMSSDVFINMHSTSLQGFCSCSEILSMIMLWWAHMTPTMTVTQLKRIWFSSPRRHTLSIVWEETIIAAVSHWAKTR